MTRLILKARSKPILAKSVKEYEGVTNKYKDALPTTGRIERQTTEKRKKLQTRVTRITFIPFIRANTRDAEATVNVPGYGGPKTVRAKRK